MFKRLENTKDKNEELLNASAQPIKLVSLVKKRTVIIMTLSSLFTNLIETLKNLKRMSLGSKYSEMNDFYTVLNAFINTHEATTTETKDHKNIIMNNVKQLYNKYLNTYKKILIVKRY